MRSDMALEPLSQTGTGFHSGIVSDRSQPHAAAAPSRPRPGQRVRTAVPAAFRFPNFGYHDLVSDPLRIAVTGSTTSPSIDITLDLLGRDKTLNGIDKLLEYIEKR